MDCMQHTRLLCPQLSLGVWSNSCSLSRWCHPTISFSAAPFSFCLQSFPASGSFPVSQLFASGGLGIGASVSVLPVNVQGWFPLGLTGLISLQSKGLSRVFSSTTVRKHQFFCTQPSLWSNSHPYMTPGKTMCLNIQTFIGKLMFLLFNILFRLVIAFLPRKKCLWISWLQALFTGILEPKKIKSVTVSAFPPSICHELMGLDDIILVFWTLSFKPAFLLSFFTSSRGSLVPLHFLPLAWYRLHTWGCW